jgi:hypothetical protein
MLEEAVGVLRCSRTGTLGCYYIGSLPFVLVLLYYLADAMQSAFAAERLIESSAGVAMAFIWMKCWHAVFAGRLMEQLCGEAPRPWGVRRVCRVVVGQASVQPWGLILLPLAAIAVIPLPWLYAFFQNACVYGDGRTDRSGDGALSSAWRQAKLWPGQNIAGMIVLYLFGIFVVINVWQAIVQPPALAKVFLNIDTAFTRGGFSQLNTTFIAIVLSLTYLCMDPLVKAFYTLRCFHGQSLRTGQDLRSELRSLVTVGAGCLVICFVLAVSPGTARAEETATPPPTSPPSARSTAERDVSPQDLDDSLDEIMTRRKYAWKLPRPEEEEDPDKEQSFISSAAETVWGWIKDAVDWVIDAIEKIWEFLFPRPERSEDYDGFGEGGSEGGGRGQFGWVGLLRYLVYAALLGIAILLIVVCFKRLKKHPVKDAEVSSEELPPIDLEDENVTADDLPESGWLDLARRLMEQGDARLALRAMYLASLAMLADKSRISIARFKSNMDYQRELARRCHSMPQLLDAFGQNVGAFEAVWYGTHEASVRIIDRFIHNQKTIGQMIADG